MPFEGGGDGERRAGGDAFAFIDTHDFAHATQAEPGFGALGRQGHHVLNGIALLQFAFGGEEHATRTQITCLAHMGLFVAAGFDKLDRQLQFKALIFTLFAHVSLRLMRTT